jgi:hypothetical protein
MPGMMHGKKIIPSENEKNSIEDQEKSACGENGYQKLQ